MKCLLFCCCHSCLVSVQSWSASQTRGATSHPPQVQAQTAGRLYGLGQRESAWMFGGLRTESHRVRVPPHGARWGHAAVWDAHSRSMCFKADSNSLSTMCGNFVARTALGGHCLVWRVDKLPLFGESGSVGAPRSGQGLEPALRTARCPQLAPCSWLVAATLQQALLEHFWILAHCSGRACRCGGWSWAASCEQRPQLSHDSSLYNYSLLTNSWKQEGLQSELVGPPGRTGHSILVACCPSVASMPPTCKPGDTWSVRPAPCWSASRAATASAKTQLPGSGTDAL